MNCVGFEKLHFWKYSVFLQSRCHSCPRKSTSVNFHSYVRTAFSRLLPIHHHKYEYHYRLSVMTWKVFVPLSAPYRELQVWFAKLKPKKFEKLFALKKPAQNIWFVRAFKAVLHSIFCKDLLNCIWLYRIVLKAFHNVSPLKALSSI